MYHPGSGGPGRPTPVLVDTPVRWGAGRVSSRRPTGGRPHYLGVTYLRVDMARDPRCGF